MVEVKTFCITKHSTWSAWSQKYLVLDDKVIQNITLYYENKSPLSFFVPEKPSSVPVINSMRHWYLFEAGSVPFCFMSREGSLKSTSNISKVAFVLKDASSCWADVPSRSTRVVLRIGHFFKMTRYKQGSGNLSSQHISVVPIQEEDIYKYLWNRNYYNKDFKKK